MENRNGTKRGRPRVHGSGSDRVTAWRRKHAREVYTITLHLKIEEDGWAVEGLARKWGVSRAEASRRLLREGIEARKDELLT